MSKPKVEKSGWFESMLTTILCDHQEEYSGPQSKVGIEIPERCPHCGADHSDSKGIEGPALVQGTCYFFGIYTGIRYEEILCRFRCQKRIGKRVYYRYLPITA